MPNALYKKMKELGVDLSWYEKSRKDKPLDKDGLVPLNDDYCGILSLYLIQKSGKMFTLSGGQAYKQVRKLDPKPRDVFFCTGCKKQFNTYDDAVKHYEGG